MDNRKTYYLICDTETFGEIESPIPYNAAFAIIDKYGKIYEKKNLLIEENWENKEMMATAYYASKIPQYEEQLANGEIEEVSIRECFYILRELMNKYDANVFIAHNARFDVRALNNLMKQISNGRKRFFLPYGTKVWDTMLMAEDTICKQKMYGEFCEKNNYLTNHAVPRYRKTAEILYRYISGNNDFVEEHKAFEDIDIERQIFAKCMAQHKPMRKNLYE